MCKNCAVGVAQRAVKLCGQLSTTSTQGTPKHTLLYKQKFIIRWFSVTYTRRLLALVHTKCIHSQSVIVLLLHYFPIPYYYHYEYLYNKEQL